MQKTVSLKKYLLTVALGFGLGGLLWGVVMYRGMIELKYAFYYSPILILSLFGGISLSWFSRNIKKTVKSILGLILGLGIGFYLTYQFSYYLYLYGGLFLVPLGYLIEIETLNKFMSLSSDIRISLLWLVFFITGSTASFFYSLLFKLKKWPLIWRGGVGFALGSLIAPVIGNSFGFLLNCQLVSYLLTFSLMSAIFGLFLSWGVYKHPKAE